MRRAHPDMSELSNDTRRAVSIRMQLRSGHGLSAQRMQKHSFRRVCNKFF